MHYSLDFNQVLVWYPEPDPDIGFFFLNCILVLVLGPFSFHIRFGPAIGSKSVFGVG